MQSFRIMSALYVSVLIMQCTRTGGQSLGDVAGDAGLGFAEGLGPLVLLGRQVLRCVHPCTTHATLRTEPRYW